MNAIKFSNETSILHNIDLGELPSLCQNNSYRMSNGRNALPYSRTDKDIKNNIPVGFAVIGYNGGNACNNKTYLYMNIPLQENDLSFMDDSKLKKYIKNHLEYFI